MPTVAPGTPRSPALAVLGARGALPPALHPAGGPAVAIIKHANPCGVALGADILDAYGRALRCDPVSAFGGIMAFNRKRRK